MVEAHEQASRGRKGEMGVRSRKPERVRRRAMPVAMSIEWKPLRDPYYVLASLLPGGGGLRRILARQSTLREVQALARGDPEQPVVGLLLGERLDCALTLTPYVLIESHVEVALASLDERAVSEAIRTLRGHVGRNKSVEVLGWYSGSRSASAAVSRTHAAIHEACFPEPWQTVLIFGDGGRAGAFFLYDSRAARWFHAPFHEVTDSKAGSRAPKPTCVAWPAYLTTASIVPLAASPQEVLSPPPPGALVSAPARQQSVGFARPVVRARHTPARDAIVGAGRAAVAAPRSALDLAKALGSRALTASRHATERVVRIRRKWAENAAQRKAEADAARAREDERRAKDAAERRAAREEAQRRAVEAEKQRTAEAEARRAAEAEARRKAAEEAERRRAAEAETRRQAAEARRQAAEAEARRRAEAAEAQREAEAEAQRKAAEEAQRRAAEDEARRKAAQEAARKAAEDEARRQAAEAEARRVTEAEAQRVAAEAEARRLAEEAEAEAQRKAAEAEAEAQRKAAEAEEDARRKAAEAREEARRRAAEAEALRISVEVAALRERLARPPVEVEGSRPETSKTAAAQVADVEDTTASDEAHRYLALARREGFELSEKIERGSAEDPETVWLLHERQSGLRLIVVTTDEEVREASLHYNLHTEDDSLLRSTPPEHCDLESRTIYGREACLRDLRVRCRRLRATGALQRDWRVTPTFQHPVSPQ